MSPARAPVALEAESGIGPGGAGQVHVDPSLTLLIGILAGLSCKACCRGASLPRDSSVRSVISTGPWTSRPQESLRYAMIRCQRYRNWTAVLDQVGSVRPSTQTDSLEKT